MDYTVFIHVLDEYGELVAQYDSQPGEDQLPTTDWAAGEVLRDQVAIWLPADLPTGTYRVVMGLYDLETGTRLIIEGAGDTHTLENFHLGE
jgi:hypothetical protein